MSRNPTYSADKEALKLLKKSDQTTDICGLHRGIVESIDDPDRLHRVKVRVWKFHGDRCPTSALPWAEVSDPNGGGGYDYGSFNVPPIGSSVWVAFEDGLLDFPVVVGAFRGAPKRDDLNSNIMLTKDGKPTSESPWKPPDEELETPKEVFDQVYYGDPHPTVRVPFKSYKGHTVVVEDGDGNEYFRIIDRSGQMIEMLCQVDETKQAGNLVQRGLRHAARGDQLPYDVMKYRRAMVRLIDLGGQEIKLDAADNNERIHIISKSRSTGSEQTITLSSGIGKESIDIRDKNNDRITLDPNSNNPIVIEDSAGNSIVFDKQNGKVKISSSKTSEETSQQKSLNVNGKYERTVGGDQVTDIKGNSKTNVGNDIAFGTLGNSSISLGGALSLMVTNTPAQGTPATTALELGVVTGGIDINTKVGNIDVETLAGNVTIDTLVGVTNINGTTVNLGTLALSIEPLIKGTTHNVLLTTWLTAHLAAQATATSALSAFVSVLTPTGLILLLIPAIGNTLFTVLCGAFWLAAESGLISAFSALTVADSTLLAALTTMLSTKSYTE
jgi:hypothetical protein